MPTQTPTPLRLDYVPCARPRQPRKRPPPQTRVCWCGKAFTVGRHRRKHCSPKCQLIAKQRGRVRPPRPTHACAKCGRKVTIRFMYCYWCRKERQQEVEAASGVGPLSPGVCGLPIRGGRCLQAVDDGTDSNGRATLWCPVHGERYAPVTRPAWTITEKGAVESKFLRYDQDERRRKELEVWHTTAVSEVEPHVSERSQRVQQNFVVIGRDLADKIRAA